MVNYTARARRGGPEKPKTRGKPRGPLLAALGTAVRGRRTELRMTLRGLAEAAGVSERFLVQLEAGDGNISVARLEDVAEALGTSGAELLARASAPSRSVVALVGLRGAGKSSVGALVAERLGMPFVELDELIVREAQMSLAAIFEMHGEQHYRGLEREVLRRVLAAGEPVVLATGGSIVTDVETWELLRRRARTIWLKASPREHWDRVVAQGDVRPMRDRPRAMYELGQLLASREPLYEQAEAVVDTSRRPLDDVVGEVAAFAVGPKA